MDYKQIQQQCEFDIYPKKDIVLVKGKDSFLWDENGKKYIDCMTGHGVASIGHCNEKVIEAIETQARNLITCTGSFYNNKRAVLMEKLVEFTPSGLNKVFLCNSGTETIEAAIKFARFSTDKSDFICAMRGFHGRTLGALSATYTPKHRERFEPLLDGFSFVPFNNYQELASKISGHTAGIILEVVQCEGGVYVGDKKYFQQVQQLCREKNILLIIDEVQTGFCRTGKKFAVEHFDIQPDILCVAKAIAGGFPMGAVICKDSVEPPVGKHGSTFGGNPLACAAAIASIDFMMENRLEKAATEKSDYLVGKLKETNLPKVKEIRHLGLVIGIELEEDVQPYLEKLMESGIFALNAGPTVIRLLPPLTIEYTELDVVIEQLIKVLK